MGLVSPVEDGWAVFRGICSILVPTGCCSDLEGDGALGNGPGNIETVNDSKEMLSQFCSLFLSVSLCRSSWKLSLLSTPWRRVKWKLPSSAKSRSWEWEFKSKPPKCTHAGCGQFCTTLEGKNTLCVPKYELTFPFLVTKIWLIFLKNGDSSSLL